MVCLDFNVTFIGQTLCREEPVDSADSIGNRLLIKNSELLLSLFSSPVI